MVRGKYLSVFVRGLCCNYVVGIEGSKRLSDGSGLCEELGAFETMVES